MPHAEDDETPAISDPDMPETAPSSAGAQPAEDDFVARIFGPRPDAVVADPSAAHRSGFVALVGRPNVGKSTLLNALVGEKVAIVSPRPQTTRRRILGIRTEPGLQAVFVDTPGVHRPKTSLGKSMVRVARGAVPDADVLVWVVDASRQPVQMDHSIARDVVEVGRPIVLALNKTDRLPPEHVAQRVAAFRAMAGEAADWTLTVATRGHNVDRLWAMIAAKLPAGPRFYPADQISDQTDRMMVGELVREAALRHLRQEVPHGVEVVVEDWRVLEDSGVLYLGAALMVERQAHRGMVIGKGGRMLKMIGSDARREIERLLERQVYLDIEVVVREDWRSDQGELRRLGYI